MTTGELRHQRKGPRPRLAIERLLARVETVGECWVWSGADNGRGYGVIGSSKRMALTHRVAYEWFVGPIPSGLVIDHLCRVRACCNPSHLRVVTTKENLFAEGSLSPSKACAAKTHCRRGHSFDESNTIKLRGERACRTCRRAAWQRSNHKRRRKVAA